MTRARKVVRRGVKRTVGKFPTVKPVKRSVHWESQLERDFYFLLEIDPNVISFKEQPMRLEYILDGKKHYYTPDLLVERTDKKQVIEVKPKSKVKEYGRIFQLASNICEKYGYEFRVITDEIIRLQPRLYNVKLLWRYSRIPIQPQHQILCREFFSTKREATLGEVMQFFVAKCAGKQIVFALLYRGLLEVDLMEKRIDMTSILRYPAGVDEE